MSDFCKNCNHDSSYHTIAVGECLVDIWFAEICQLTLCIFERQSVLSKSTGLLYGSTASCRSIQCCMYLNTWIATRHGFEPDWCHKFVWASCAPALSKALYSNCSMVRRSRKAVDPVYMYINIYSYISTLFPCLWLVKRPHVTMHKYRSWPCQ